MEIGDVWVIGCIVNAILVIGFIIALARKNDAKKLPVWFYLFICPIFIALSISAWIMFFSAKFWDKFG